MSEYAEVRPVPGRLVFVPENGRPLSPKGERVELTPFWRRRLMDGDVAEIPAAPAQPKPVSEGQSVEPPAEAHEESPEVSAEGEESPEDPPEAEEPAEDEEEN